MAKKAAAGNKSQAIRDALAAHPVKGPKDIAAMLVEQGFKVNAQYVSIVKSNLNKKAGRKPVRVLKKKPGRKPAASSSGATLSVMDAALALIQAAGGLDKARATLATIEQIRSMV